MFYLFYKIFIFSVYKEKDDIRSAKVFFNFFHESVNSHYLEPANHIAHVIVYENTLVDQSKRTYCPNYFIIKFEIVIFVFSFFFLLHFEVFS